MRILLRTKLIVSLLSVVFISGLVSTIIGVSLIGNGIIRQAQDKVRTDLNSAREIYNEMMKDVFVVAKFNASRVLLREALVKRDRAYLLKITAQVLKNENIDILDIIDASGTVIVRGQRPGKFGDNQGDNKIIQWVLRNKRATSATLVIDQVELKKESNDLAQQSTINILPTPKAKFQRSGEEKNGMVIAAAAPIIDENQKVLGVIYSGKLINRNYEIVDKVKNTVFQDEKYEGKDIGTATIFLGDLRISTNVMNLDGTRAIGTLIAKDVYDAVLERGMPWVARAFVVNAWYITAYEPIKDISGQIIGVLYVGILEEKFIDMRNRVVFIFLGITLLGIAIAFTMSFILANGIVRPVSRLATAAQRIAEGNFPEKVEIKTDDEIADLGRAFQFMISSIKVRDEELKEVAQKTVAEAERLAMIGQLAAGVAHEINNPLTGILLYCDLVLKSMAKDDSKRVTLEKISHEALRCKAIVKGLLDYSRQKKPETKETLVNQIIESSLSLVKNQALFQNIEIKKELEQSLPVIKIDPQQIQQVFMNIIINAAEAMEGKGELSIKSQLSDDKRYVVISFKDTGPGIPQENLKRIFEPFFTTKDASHGVGLGLAISKGIIENHNGSVEVSSESGKGTKFLIKLPIL